MNDVSEREDVSEHGENPGNGVQVWDEPYPGQVVIQFGFMESLQSFRTNCHTNITGQHSTKPSSTCK